MARQTITLPTEIHDIIVGILAEEGDVKTVKILARTCKSILPTCRSHIFATLDLVPIQGLDNSCDDTADTFSRLLENLRRVFASNPSLTFYVRKVYYMIRRIDDKPQDFHSVLKGCSRVKTLGLRGTIHDAGTYRTSVDWLNVSASLRAALASILHSPYFMELHLDHISNFPIRILAGSRNLSHLTIDAADFQDDVVSDWRCGPTLRAACTRPLF
ncbi:hypothetical protein GALMADRAFT_59586 [Galerina marginata CBS 339.88]|uniref:F-box domain-containing protein n=1 Tax=Galerina marginata (strain CBS 339.88) TaxID=685588 RepID=A0A067TF59_GALM3|nr:hypothetical protein GALMADRAFT_59586 [Galerina marginata CBS 339.88]